MVSHCGFNLHLSMATDTEHLFICLSALCMSFLEKCLFRSFAHFLIALFVFLEWNCVCSLLFRRSDPCLRYHWQIHFPYSWFSFHFSAVFFSCAEAFYFDEVPFVYSFLYVPHSRGHLSENNAAWNILDFPAYVLF